MHPRLVAICVLVPWAIGCGGASEPSRTASPVAAARARAVVRDRARRAEEGTLTPRVFVHVASAHGATAELPRETGEGVTMIVRRIVDRTGFATRWPGALPTQAELTARGSIAFIVSSTLGEVAITNVGPRTEIACTVAIRIAPWNGVDGGELWEPARAATSTGSGTATTGNLEPQIASGVRTCAEAVAEQVTSQQVVPFLRRVVSSG